MKFLSFRLVLVLFAAVILSGCSIFQRNKKNETITLKYWGVLESAETMAQITAQYQKIRPNINIVYEKKSVQQYRETLETQIENGIGPDVFMFHNTWVPMLNEELQPISADIISPSEFKNNYYPTVNDLRNRDGRYIGIPSGIDGLALYWNENIFRAAGVAGPPSTWQQVDDISKRLTVLGPDGNIRTSGIAIGTATNVDHFSDILGMMVLQNNGDLKTPTDKESVDALEYYVRFAKGDNRVWDETQQSSTLAFKAGNLAMYFGPSWRAREFRENPNLAFKVAPVPQLEGRKVSWSSYWAIGASSQSEYKEEAMDFLKYLADDQVQINTFTLSSRNTQNDVPQAYSKVSLASKLSADQIFGAYVSDAPFMSSFPMASFTFDNGLNDNIIKAYKTAVTKALASTPAKDALEEAVPLIKQAFDKAASTAAN